MVAESYNDTWEWALSSNKDIPLLLTPENNSTCAAIPSWMKQLLGRYAYFASSACDIRELTGHVPPEWRTVCQLRPKRETYYHAPRWSWPILYFRGSTSDYFRGKKGLDLGARIHYLAGPHRGLEAIANYSRLAETLVPHFEYYSLQVFVSKGSPGGLPVGTLLRKQSIEDRPSIFDEIFNAPEVQPLKFHPSHRGIY